MKNTQRFIVIPLILLLFSCSEEEEEMLPAMETSTISFRITDFQDETGQYKDRLVEAESQIEFNQPWGIETEDSVNISKVSYFTLPGDELYSRKNIQIILGKFEAKRNLIYDSFFQVWKYKTIDEEFHLFYHAYDKVNIQLEANRKFATFWAQRSDQMFTISNISKVIVNGEEKWAIEAEFHGKAYDSRFFSDPDLEVFELTEGKFSGVVN